MSTYVDTRSTSRHPLLSAQADIRTIEDPDFNPGTLFGNNPHSQHPRQYIHRLVNVGLGDDERRDKAQDIVADGT